jgi:hypothetical protein
MRFEVLTAAKLSKFKKMHYFTLTTDYTWINICRFINHSPGYLDVNVLFCFVILLFRSPATCR